jgi:hypothetical protein
MSMFVDFAGGTLAPRAKRGNASPPLNLDIRREERLFNVFLGVQEWRGGCSKETMNRSPAKGICKRRDTLAVAGLVRRGEMKRGASETLWRLSDSKVWN